MKKIKSWNELFCYYMLWKKWIFKCCNYSNSSLSHGYTAHSIIFDKITFCIKYFISPLINKENKNWWFHLKQKFLEICIMQRFKHKFKKLDSSEINRQTSQNTKHQISSSFTFEFQTLSKRIARIRANPQPGRKILDGSLHLCFANNIANIQQAVYWIERISECRHWTRDRKKIYTYYGICITPTVVAKGMFPLTLVPLFVAFVPPDGVFIDIYGPEAIALKGNRIENLFSSRLFYVHLFGSRENSQRNTAMRPWWP